MSGYVLLNDEGDDRADLACEVLANMNGRDWPSDYVKRRGGDLVAVNAAFLALNRIGFAHASPFDQKDDGPVYYMTSAGANARTFHRRRRLASTQKNHSGLRKAVEDAYKILEHPEPDYEDRAKAVLEAALDADDAATKGNPHA